MNSAPLLRRAALGLGLAALAAAALAQAPKVQLALAVDSGFSSNTGVVHRIDINTGKYLGSFGAGSLLTPVAVAVQPSTGIAFVADSVAIKKFDVSTGRFLGTVARASSFGSLGVGAMRFSPSGSLYVVGEAPFSGLSGYYNATLFRVNPATGSTIASVNAAISPNGDLIQLGFRAVGNVEVFDRDDYNSYSDRFDPTTLAYRGYTYTAGFDQADFRASSDAFLRVQGNIFGGTGDFGTGSQLATASSSTSSLFAEGALGQSYLLFAYASGVQLVDFDTSAAPYLSGIRNLPSFAHGAFVDLAIYMK